MKPQHWQLIHGTLRAGNRQRVTEEHPSESAALDALIRYAQAYQVQGVTIEYATITDPQRVKKNAIPQIQHLVVSAPPTRGRGVVQWNYPRMKGQR